MTRSFALRASAEFHQGETPEEAMNIISEAFSAPYIDSWRVEQLETRQWAGARPEYVDGVVRVDFTTTITLDG